MEEKSVPSIEVPDEEGAPPKGEPADSGETHKHQPKSKDFLSVIGINYEKRRRASASYRIEKNTVVMEDESGKQKKFEIVSTKEQHGAFRKAVPILPPPLAILCLILNLIPGLGTFVSALGGCCCGYPTEYESRLKALGFNLLAAFLQLILAPLVVGLIWSIQRGALIFQLALKEKVEKSPEEEEATTEPA